MDSILFPHFYLSNENIIRHQYLYSTTLLRLLSSDRPTRDSKEVKQLISGLSFPENQVVEDHLENGIERFLTVLSEAYEQKNELYFPALQKFGVERTATKTFHFSRTVELKQAVEKMQELGFAKSDHAGSWCMSTPKMVQIFVTCATVEYQRQKNIPRCSDHPEHDELATVIECIPQTDSPTDHLTKVIFEFPYYIPEGISNLSVDNLQKLRECILPQSSMYSDTIKKIADSISVVSSIEKIKSTLEYEIIPIHELNHTIQTNIISNGYKAKECRGQYRWYVKSESSLTSLIDANAITANQGLLYAIQQTASKNQIEGLLQYPGCFIWTLGTLNEGKGILNRLKKLWG